MRPPWQSQLDVSVFEHVPFCVAIGDKLIDVGHHERFGGIGVEKLGDRVGRGLGSATPRSPGLCRIHLAKT